MRPRYRTYGMETPTRATPEWMERGRCHQLVAERRAVPDVWFPFEKDVAAVERAKFLCATCTVREQCLQWALDRDEPDGVWGGLTHRERRNLARRERAKAKASARAGAQNKSDCEEGRRRAS